MNKKINLDKLKKAGYRFSIVASIIGNSTRPFCILCNSEPEIMVPFYWVEDRKKFVIKYDLCKNCNEELLGLSKQDQISLIVKVIENKILGLPQIKRANFQGENDVK